MRTRTVTNNDPAAHRDVATRRILILGGGFAGAYTALHLERRLAGVPDEEIVLAARENFVLFTPMLHEVAGSDVALTDVVQPLHRTRVLIVKIESIDLAGKRVRILHPDLAQAFDLNYDQLVLAIGAVPNFYRTPGIENTPWFDCELWAPPADTVD
jgi:NADH dehydrogenase